jgi:hypothetical protein
MEQTAKLKPFVVNYNNLAMPDGSDKRITALGNKISYHVPFVAAAHIPFQKGFGKEITLNLNNEDVSINMHDRPNRIDLKNLDEIINAHRDLCKLIGQGSKALVKVNVTGDGPTSKSKKIRFSSINFEQQVINKFDPAESFERVTRTHNFTVPASLLVTNEHGTFAPRWFLNKSVHEKAGFWPKVIEGEVLFDSDRLWVEIFKPLADSLSY